MVLLSFFMIATALVLLAWSMVLLMIIKCGTTAMMIINIASSLYFGDGFVITFKLFFENKNKKISIHFCSFNPF